MFVSVPTAVFPAVSVARNGMTDQSTDNCTANDRRTIAAARKSANNAASHRTGDCRAGM
jgi:hypothetical protein